MERGKEEDIKMGKEWKGEDRSERDGRGVDRNQKERGYGEWGVTEVELKEKGRDEEG